jgi:hypothetical protein
MPRPQPAVPPLIAADVLRPDHVYHPQYLRWLEARKARMGEPSAVSSKRKARLFLACNPVLKTAWASIWRRHDLQEKAAA